MPDPSELSDEDLVDALVRLDGGLTAWEVDFIESIEGFLETHEELTERQREVAERILAEQDED